MSKRVLVPIANGSEEIEAVCVIDVLRRAGADVVVASVENELQVIASRGVKLVADQLLDNCVGEFDLIVLPGGMPGAERLRDTPALIERLQQQRQSQRLIGAICAAPVVVLDSHQLLSQKSTAHPAFSQHLTDQSQVCSRVVIDGNCVTSRGPGTALEFALTLVSLLYGDEKAQQVAEPMVMP
ncbi:MAG: DJ-1/PfpI family protein [Motiliproteus sp.]|nr:DJ-1/PfpI family protein [Motiliproteus sp.]MCW9052850.1 DJ-1/PfpI family protein [Motiliproteus sp.]